VSEQAVAGIMLIAVPILFNACFTLLAQRFDYSDVLRRPSHEVLKRFRACGTSLIVIWWLFALSAMLFTALAVQARQAAQARAFADQGHGGSRHAQELGELVRGNVQPSCNTRRAISRLDLGHVLALRCNVIRFLLWMAGWGLIPQPPRRAGRKNVIGA
jgi:hypothetical protein